MADEEWLIYMLLLLIVVTTPDTTIKYIGLFITILYFLATQKIITRK